MSKKNDFLEKLAQLCDDYSATFTYTNDEDGIHIEIGGTGSRDEIFVGYLDFISRAAQDLRNAKDA